MQQKNKVGSKAQCLVLVIPATKRSLEPRSLSLDNIVRPTSKNKPIKIKNLNKIECEQEGATQESPAPSRAPKKTVKGGIYAP
jgi:electron transfer flavoprotein alpha/beta subunit